MKIITFEFKNDIIEVVDNFVSIKKLCENLGIDKANQYKKIQSDETYQSEFREIKINGIIQKVLCIPIDKINGWLFSINQNKVKPEAKQKLIEYKKECFNVLHDYFNKGYAIQPEIVEALKQTIQDRDDIIMAQNKLIADNSKPKNKPNDIFMNDPVLHNNFLDFLFQANKAVHEVNIIRHLSPGLDTTHQSLSNFMLHITRRYEKIRGVDKYKVPQIEQK